MKHTIRYIRASTIALFVLLVVFVGQPATAEEVEIIEVERTTTEREVYQSHNTDTSLLRFELVQEVELYYRVPFVPHSAVGDCNLGGGASVLGHTVEFNHRGITYEICVWRGQETHGKIIPQMLKGENTTPFGTNQHTLINNTPPMTYTKRGEDVDASIIVIVFDRNTNQFIDSIHSNNGLALVGYSHSEGGTSPCIILIVSTSNGLFHQENSCETVLPLQNMLVPSIKNTHDNVDWIYTYIPPVYPTVVKVKDAVLKVETAHNGIQYATATFEVEMLGGAGNTKPVVLLLQSHKGCVSFVGSQTNTIADCTITSNISGRGLYGLSTHEQTPYSYTITASTTLFNERSVKAILTNLGFNWLDTLNGYYEPHRAQVPLHIETPLVDTNES